MTRLLNKLTSYDKYLIFALRIDKG